MPTVKQLSRIFSQDDSLNRLQDQLASALNPILREIKGDLSGPLESPTVGALRGRPIANTAPITGQSLVWDGTQWAPGTGGGAVNSVTATAPLASSGGANPDISLTGIVPAANGGTGLSTSGVVAGYVLTADGLGGWTSGPVPGAAPTGPAGGVLGYFGSTYPNPNGLAPIYIGAENVIRVAQNTIGGGPIIRFDPYNDSSLFFNSVAQIVGPRSDASGSSHFLFPGGTMLVLGGDGTPYYSGSEGGAAILRGGQGTGGRPCGAAVVEGGLAASTQTGGDAYVRGGSSPFGTLGRVYIGSTNTSSVYISSAAPAASVYVQNQQVDLVTALPTTGQLLGYNGTKWVPTSITAAAALAKFGNTLVVDAINGSDLTGTVNGLPFATPEAAIAYINTHSLTGVTVWIMPGTYALSAGITIPDTCSLRGLSTQTTKLTLAGSNPGSTVTMLTMGENSRVEDLSLLLTSTNATTNLVGIRTPNTTSTTSKIRTCVLTVDNSTLAHTTSTNVYGIHDDGTGTLGDASFSFNFSRGVTISVYSNGGGNKRAVYVSTANDIAFRDTNFYVAAPVSSSSAGSYVGVETNNSTSAAQFRTCSISGPTTAGSYTGSDILQTLPTSGFNNHGVQLGPGTDLINRTAGGKPFTAYITPVTLDYGLNGNLVNSPHYLWVGVQTAADATEVFYKFQQQAICYGMGISLRTAPGVGESITVTVHKSTTGVAGSGVATSITATISGTAKSADHYTSSVDFAAGEYLSVEIDGTSGNAAQDLVVQLDLF